MNCLKCNGLMIEKLSKRISRTLICPECGCFEWYAGGVLKCAYMVRKDREETHNIEGAEKVLPGVTV